MKKYIFGALALAATLSMSSCDDFLEVKPSGIVDEELAFDDPEAMVTAAYAALGADWYTYPFNLWPYGSLASDDALKGGGDTGDTEYHAVEMWSSLSSTNPGGHMDELWYHLYVSISRCNRAIMAVRDKGEEKLGAAAKSRMGEARFLRGHFYFKLAQVFNQVPFIDEIILANAEQEQTRNDELTHAQLMDKIIEDFQFAYENLPEVQSEKARVTKYAAAAMLAKCYLNKAYGDGYEANTGYSHINAADMAKVVEYTNVIANGPFKYEADFGDLFMQDNRNGVESIFAVQHSNYEDDNTKFGRSNWSNMLNGCHGIWSKGWDFHKPSQNLVNAFKVDENGFPMFKDYEKEHNIYPLNGVVQDQKWDPRLFHTVGLPTYPYKYESAYTLDKDKNARCPSSYGYYTSLKEVPQRSKGESYTEGTWQGFAMNDYVVRFSEVMLWRAEALIETGKIADGLEIINKIRERANNSVAKYINYAADKIQRLGMYDTTGTSLEDARMYLRWEKRLEMAMESERFFDLRRWGMASETMNAYFAAEQNSNYEGMDYAGYLAAAHFTAGKNEFWPIPYQQLFYVPGLYSQNAGY